MPFGTSNLYMEKYFSNLKTYKIKAISRELYIVIKEHGPVDLIFAL